MSDQFMPLRKNPQVIHTVALSKNGRYSLAVAANSATGCRNPQRYRRTSAQFTIAGVFFRLQSSVMAAVCGQASAWPGSCISGIPTPHIAATQSRRKDRGSSQKDMGAPHMHAINPFKIRAAAHRAMALAALHANSSLATRLSRYNAHMSKARALEAAGGAQ
ncbi:ash family protein [Pseudomonas fluorescens]|nr:ash family protein [Pseudomonas fluorescens]MBD8774700.1 ash family protein [Pseudomonas fluorescens]MBD8779839.1 ash family protein [Pseudomonas fluorescens]MBD8796846.1 ash family protein [Pseudomonas fluorescens]